MGSGDQHPFCAALTNIILLPSGDHAGLLSNPRLAVRFVAPEPSAFITQMSPLRTNASTPSRDHAGSVLNPGSFVRLTAPLPSACMREMSECAKGRSQPSKAILEPSGDQLGRVFQPDPEPASATMLEPSAFTT